MTQIVLAGGQNLGVKCLKLLLESTEHEVVLVICRNDDHGEDSIFPSLKKIAIENGISTITPDDVNSESVIKRVRDLDAGIVLSIMYNNIFKSEFIDIFEARLGIINIHYAPLPLYSGYWPEMWAIWNNEKEFGITFHYIDKGVDTGDIACKTLFPISPDETRKSLYEKCDIKAFSLFKQNLSCFLSKKMASIKQDNSKRTYYGRCLPTDGIIDLDWDKEISERYIRATSFYPFIGGKIKVNNKIFSVVDKDLGFFKAHYMEE
jgi:methionyl-tRNA formyltransferase